MILGTVPQSYRIPFKRPPQASYYTPQMPDASFMTHLNPFQQVYPAMVALPSRVPPRPRLMAPGLVENPTGAPLGPMPMNVPTRQLALRRPGWPSGPGMPVRPRDMGPRVGGDARAVAQGMIPAGPPVQVDTPTTPAPMGGFGAAANGGAWAFRRFRRDGYNVITQGGFPQVVSDARGIRAPVVDAGRTVRASSWASFPGSNRPAGTYAF